MLERNILACSNMILNKFNKQGTRSCVWFGTSVWRYKGLCMYIIGTPILLRPQPLPPLQELIMICLKFVTWHEKGSKASAHFAWDWLYKTKIARDGWYQTHFPFLKQEEKVSPCRCRGKKNLSKRKMRKVQSRRMNTFGCLCFPFLKPLHFKNERWC